MTELKLSEIKGFLPKIMQNKIIADINLLEYVEAVVCPECRGKGYIDAYQNKCKSCSTGAVIRVKE